MASDCKLFPNFKDYEVKGLGQKQNNSKCGEKVIKLRRRELRNHTRLAKYKLRFIWIYSAIKQNLKAAVLI